MKSLKKRRALWFCLTALSALVSLIAIPGIIISARSHDWLWFILCLAGLVWGMYGMPLLGMAYMHCHFIIQLLTLVTRKGILDLPTLAIKLGRTKEQVSRALTKQIAHEHLTGYTFDGETLTLTDRE